MRYKLSLAARYLHIALLLPIVGGASAATKELDLRIDEPRPVAGAVLALDKRHKVLVTYEDPQYQYEGDLRDYSSDVRNDQHKYAPGKAPPVIAPAAGIINIRYSVSAETGQPADVAGLVRKIVDDHNGRGVLGTFALEQSEKYLHVVPLRVRNRRGEWENQMSILSVAITIPRTERTTYETLLLISNAISERIGVKVGMGSVPLNLVNSTRSEISANNESARSVLIRTLSATGSDLAWILLFDPGAKFYALNLLPVATRDPPPAAPPVSPTPSSSPTGGQAPAVR